MDTKPIIIICDNTQTDFGPPPFEFVGMRVTITMSWWDRLKRRLRHPFTRFKSVEGMVTEMTEDMLAIGGMHEAAMGVE